nr:MAG TPA: hypothetical protein [Caudoviricetes sp.]
MLRDRASFLHCHFADGLDDLGSFGIEDHGNRLYCGRYRLAVGCHILAVGKMQNTRRNRRVVLLTHSPLQLIGFDSRAHARTHAQKFILLFVFPESILYNLREHAESYKCQRSFVRYGNNRAVGQYPVAVSWIRFHPFCILLELDFKSFGGICTRAAHFAGGLAVECLIGSFRSLCHRKRVCGRMNSHRPSFPGNLLPTTCPFVVKIRGCCRFSCPWPASSQAYDAKERTIGTLCNSLTKNFQIF